MEDVRMQQQQTLDGGVRTIVIFHFENIPPVEVQSPLVLRDLKQKLVADKNSSNPCSEYETLADRGKMLTARHSMNYRSVFIDMRKVAGISVIDVDPNKLIVPAHGIITQ